MQILSRNPDFSFSQFEMVCLDTLIFSATVSWVNPDFIRASFNFFPISISVYLLSGTSFHIACPMSIKLPLHDRFSHQFSCQNYFTQRIYEACHRGQKKSHIPRPHDTNISIPIPIRITPPSTSAFPESFVPIVFPR